MNIWMMVTSLVMILIGIAGLVAWFNFEKIPSWVSAVGLVIGGPLVMVGICMFVGSFAGEGYYQYKTFNGETGTSRYCHVLRGGIICYSHGGAVNVESYKWIRSEE